MTGLLGNRSPKLEPTGNATFSFPTGKPHYNLPPDPNKIANWTTEKIIYLTYFLAVPIAAIIFLIWVHIRWPEKPVRTKTEVPSQTIEVDKDIKGAEDGGSVESGGDVEKVDSGRVPSMNSGEPLMVELCGLESGEGRKRSMMDLGGKSAKEGVRDEDDLEIQVIERK